MIAFILGLFLGFGGAASLVGYLFARREQRKKTAFRRKLEQLRIQMDEAERRRIIEDRLPFDEAVRRLRALLQDEIRALKSARRGMKEESQHNMETLTPHWGRRSSVRMLRGVKRK